MRLLILALMTLINTYVFSQTCTSSIMFNTASGFPSGLASDGNLFWVSQSDIAINATIDIYDEFGNFVQNIYSAVGFSNVATSLEIVEDTIWVVKEQSAKLLKMNKWDGTLYATFDLPTFSNSVPIDPNNNGITYDGTYLWNVEYYTYVGVNLFKINPLNGAVLDTIGLNIKNILPLKFINNKMYGVTYNSEKLYEIDVVTGIATYVMDWCVPYPLDLAYSPTKNELYQISGAIVYGGTQSVNKIAGIGVLTGNEIVPIVENNSIEISPNPVLDNLRIYCSDFKRGEIKIINSVGETYFSGQMINHQFEKNISEYAPGIYVVILKNKEKRVVEKFIKL